MDMDQLYRPRARKEGLLVREVQDELLIYDLERDKAHCLNETAALVWRHCDGDHDTKSIAERMAAQLANPVDETLVWHALQQFNKDHLLQDKFVPPPEMAGINRRQMIRTLGLAAAVAVPVVISIVAPTSAQAVSCLSGGSACTGSAQCCSGMCSNNVCA
jgi:hypothetical protein